MNNNMKNFREASDLILKNIYVTNELKRKTLEKCTHRKVSKIKPVLTATFSSALIVFFGIFNYFFHKPTITDNHITKSINQGYKNSSNNENKIQEAPKIAEGIDSHKSHSAASNNIKNNEAAAQKKNIDIAMKDSNNILQNKSINALNENVSTDSQSKNNSNKPSDNILQNRVDAINSKSISNSNFNSNIISDSSSNSNLVTQVNPSLASVPEPLNLEKAEKYFEGKVLLPSYIPEGFKLTDISIPDDKQKCIKLEYSSGSADFEILQTKDLSKLEGTESISIGNNIAYVNSVKDEKTNVVTTKITWILDNIEYSLSSSLPEDSLIKIAKSINN
jgi:hypothetical protein